MRVQSGTRLQLSLSEILGQATNITWWHQTQQIGSTGSVPAFVIPEFGVAHNGYYEARFTSSGSGTTTSSVGLEIVATPLARPPLLNLSTRVRLTIESPTFTTGFVIGQDGVPTTGVRTF